MTAAGPCPEIEAGPGQVVLTTFAHSPTLVVSLSVSGEPTLIGTTSQHPFWSEDQRDWVGATSLAVGERLEARDGGEALALGWEVRGDEPVYNIEVEGDHCYRVGEQGLLVHNVSVPPGDPANPLNLSPTYNSYPVRLYHGTNEDGLRGIRQLRGIRGYAGDPNRDFGRGFYTTPILALARSSARRIGGVPIVLRFDVPLGQLTPAIPRIRIFINQEGCRAADNWRAFVDEMRAGGMHDFDIVSGWLWNPGNIPPMGWQVSFHTAAATFILNSILVQRSRGPDPFITPSINPVTLVVNDMTGEWLPPNQWGGFLNQAD